MPVPPPRKPSRPPRPSVGGRGVTPRVVVSISVSADVLTKIDRAAKKVGHTRSRFIAYAASIAAGVAPEAA